MDEGEKVWVTIWQNGSPRVRYMTRGLIHRVQIWAEKNKLDIVIIENRSRGERSS